MRNTLSLSKSTTSTLARKASSDKRRGAAAILGVFLIAAMTILLSMSVDLGQIHTAQSELQRTGDASALAACWELINAKEARLPSTQTNNQVRDAAQSLALANAINGEGPLLESGDVTLGTYDYGSRQFVESNATSANAVRVLVNRQANSNGEVPLFFGSVLGRSSQPMSTSSTAAMLSNVEGFVTPSDSSETLDILPFALDLQTWNAVLAGETTDVYSYNGAVTSGSNGLYECNLYPQGTGSPGNRGTVDIGGSNNSTADIARQILHGISAEDIEDLGHPIEFDSNGTLVLNGDTGISAGVKDELASIIGEKRIIPIYSNVSGNGNNAMYTIVKFVGVRILDVRLTGKMNQKHVLVEPAVIASRNLKLSTSSQSYSDYLYTRVMLVD